jgi:hypothetical protein
MACGSGGNRDRLTGVKPLIGLAAVALALLLAPSTVGAQSELPVGESKGVRVVRQDRAIVVVFTDRADKLHERLAGKRVIVSCTTLRDDGTNTGSQVMTVPVERRRLFTGDLTPNIDYCRLWRRARKGNPKRIIVSVPLTQKGAVFLDEETKTLTMFGVLILAEFVQKEEKLDGFPTYDEFLQSLPRRARRTFSRRVVPLAALTDVPPARTIGYYSDGAQQAGVSMVSKVGRLLFIRYGPDEVLTTNVAGFMFNPPH